MSLLTYRRKWMLAGFLAAFAGDWLLAIRGSPTRSPGFLAGVACFAAAHILWSVGQLREARPRWRPFLVAAIPLLLFTGVRVAPVLPMATAIAIVAYAAVSAFSLSVASSSPRRTYAIGISLLVFSDIMIGGRIIHAPGYGSLVGPFYIAAELCLLASFFMRDEVRPVARPARDPLRLTLSLGAVAAICFLAAMATFPGGGYNPCMRMLSALGRTVVREIEWPWCHFFFTIGMAASTGASLATLLSLRDRVTGGRRTALSWGAAINAAGLLSIAAVPENISMPFHNVGCWLAAIGGGTALLALNRRVVSRAWTISLLSIVGLFSIAVGMHALKLIRFAPAVPTLQKALIVSFTAWLIRLAWGACPRSRKAAILLSLVLLAFVSLLAYILIPFPVPRSPFPVPRSPFSTSQHSLTADERAALRWLDHVTGHLPKDEEREWWDIGGSQHGLFAKRYHIAFCGYAAAAIGWRGGEVERQVAARILLRCIGRYIRNDVWGYSMSKSYWGRKSWAPDPCYRENVMFTGHLLQLLALYETFSGDKSFWREGWDFVWRDGRSVHYDVEKLIGVTVHQMRHGPNGGVCCEPGLMFFPCNNHPHVALALFSRLGHGDWSGDARRWEKWALRRFRRPMFGGGALNLVWHARSNIMFPRGNNGLDGWSLVWYEPWATDRASALALWNEAAACIDWATLEKPDVATDGEYDPCDPAAGVSQVASAAFLSAAARACDDIATAERLEGITDRNLVRKDGMLWLDIDREWRVGATAIRIIALTEANGFRFRDILKSRP